MSRTAKDDRPNDAATQIARLTVENALLREALTKLDAVLDLDPAEAVAFAFQVGIEDATGLREACVVTRAALACRTAAG